MRKRGLNSFNLKDLNSMKNLAPQRKNGIHIFDLFVGRRYEAKRPQKFCGGALIILWILGFLAYVINPLTFSITSFKFETSWPPAVARVF